MDLMADSSAFDGKKLVADVLDQAAALESLGLYHGDLRSWNILVGSDDHAVLIDYGAIRRTRADNVWPDDVFLSFFTFLYEVAHRRVVRGPSGACAVISPFNLPFPYRETRRVVVGASGRQLVLRRA
jgi:O-antigen chain-terminating methyltransferase